MKKNLIQTTYLYGKLPSLNEKDHSKFNDNDLFINDNTLPSVFLKKIKIWFGIIDEKIPPCLLGMKCWYINYMTCEKKESIYHGSKLESQVIESKELEVKDRDYFNKIEFGIDNYIHHFKITTKKGEFLEFGDINDDIEKILRINMDDNMILFFHGIFCSKGFNAIRVKYISRKDYIYYRINELLILRHFLKKDQKMKEKYLKKGNNNNELDLPMKYAFHMCLLPDAIFYLILRYL